MRNPVGVEAVRPLVRLMDEQGGYLIFLVLAVGSAVSLILRYRRSRGEQRQQIKWFTLAAAALASGFLVSALLSEVFGFRGGFVEDVLPALGLVSLPVGAGIGILRYRLFDIDVVINRALVFTVLAGLITAVYVGIVVGIGALVGSRGNLLLSILATALIAVGFQRIRERARHFANRLVYGKRATPYELLSEFANRLGTAYSAEDVLPRMARLVGEGTGGARARVWLRVGSELRPEGIWPPDGQVPTPVPVAGGTLPAFPEEDAAFPVRDRGELLGALTVSLRPSEALTPTHEKLLQDLAAQAGLILRNVRLIQELRASRQRIVAAQDQERRRLERDIHDGAQQQLVALAVRLNLAQTLASKKAPEVADLLEGIKGETQETLENLRDLARGIYPPLLADKGLPAAVEAQARKAPVPVTVDSDGVGRLRQEVEAGVYFCILEALQNVSKYAEASQVMIRLDRRDGDLTFEVSDDGRGFDPASTPRGTGLQNMSDRVEALGGHLEIRSSPGEGTTVTGRLHVPPGGTG